MASATAAQIQSFVVCPLACAAAITLVNTSGRSSTFLLD
jgi:hypothetical protein